MALLAKGWRGGQAVLASNSNSDSDSDSETASDSEPAPESPVEAGPVRSSKSGVSHNSLRSNMCEP